MTHKNSLEQHSRVYGDCTESDLYASSVRFSFSTIRGSCVNRRLDTSILIRINQFHYTSHGFVVNAAEGSQIKRSGLDSKAVPKPCMSIDVWTVIFEGKAVI